MASIIESIDLGCAGNLMLVFVSLTAALLRLSANDCYADKATLPDFIAKVRFEYIATAVNYDEELFAN